MIKSSSDEWRFPHTNTHAHTESKNRYDLLEKKHFVQKNEASAVNKNGKQMTSDLAWIIGFYMRYANH